MDKKDLTEFIDFIIKNPEEVESDPELQQKVYDYGLEDILDPSKADQSPREEYWSDGSRRRYRDGEERWPDGSIKRYRDGEERRPNGKIKKRP